jgi:aryl-alcohol dehydrogenase-like predicted oxidoreductase
MDHRNLGRTGVRVSPLCLGCMMFGEPDQAEAIIGRAFDAGVNFIDTANVYGRGKSEEVVGEAMKRLGNRDKLVLATKAHGRMADDDPNARGNSRRHLIQACEDSLRRLQTDWIDLYQIHRPQSDIPIDETLRALDDLVRAGKVRYLGSSTFHAWQVVEAQWVAREWRVSPFVCEQPPYHLLDRRIERGLVPAAQPYGMAIIPWSPLAGGFLTGKYEKGQDPPEGSRLSKNDPRSILNDDDAWAVLDVLRQVADELGCNCTQAALAWCRDQPGVTSPIIGPKSNEQLDDNLKSMDFALTPEQRERLDEVARPGGVTRHFYEADFAPPTVREGRGIERSRVNWRR